MKLIAKDYFCIILIIATFATSLMYFNELPDEMVTHWGFDGSPDGWTPKELGAFIGPGISLLVYGLFLAVPKIMVHKKEFGRSKDYYENIKVIMAVFFFVLNFVIIFSNLGMHIPIGIVVGSLVAVLLFYVGHIIPNFEKNYFVGIRTPWALANKKVWKKTQKFGGKVFKIMALLVFLSIFIPEHTFWILISSVIGGLIIIFWYSYNEYKKLN